MADNAPFYSGAGPRRDKTLADAEAKAMGNPSTPAPSPTPAPVSTPSPKPENPGIVDRIKGALGFMDGGIVESCHNPENRLPGHAMHGKGKR